MSALHVVEHSSAVRWCAGGSERPPGLLGSFATGVVCLALLPSFAGSMCGPLLEGVRRQWLQVRHEQKLQCACCNGSQ